MILWYSGICLRLGMLCTTILMVLGFSFSSASILHMNILWFFLLWSEEGISEVLISIFVDLMDDVTHKYKYWCFSYLKKISDKFNEFISNVNSSKDRHMLEMILGFVLQTQFDFCSFMKRFSLQYFYISFHIIWCNDWWVILA